ncbi:MAG: ribonuclease III [Rikenellaceae bacterium]
MSIRLAIRRLFRRNFDADREFIKVIDDIIGTIPYNVDLYKLALIHKSASIHIEGRGSINNERLEYLGDAIINAVTSDFLYIEYPELREGSLTQLRAKIISRQSLNAIARQIGLDKHVVCKSTGNHNQKHIFGDAFEALIGAIYLDQGYDFVNRFLINDIFANCLDSDKIENVETDYKSRLIEWAQREHLPIEFKTAEDNSQKSLSVHNFCSKVLISGVEVGYGTGDSKKEAEQQAAYSVSQGGISDRESDAILESVDKLEVDNESLQVKSDNIEE